MSLVEPSSPSNRWPILIMGIGLLFGLLAGVIVFFGAPAAPSLSTGKATGTPAPAPVVGAPAPDFTLKNLQNADVQLAALKGQVVLINFWATWCGPCRLEMPAIERRYELWKAQGLVVLGVNVDEAAPDVQAYVDELGLTFPVLLDPGSRLTDFYRVQGFPTTFFVGRDGGIAQLHVGSLTEGQLDEYLAQLGFVGQ